ncbi:MAG TPA: HepT-like ribonuclease domain-containing protein [Bacteroidia bacterium]|nr:HepT-like ribonuclease domain-containing protein [Bacteroidia bacterium]
MSSLERDKVRIQHVLQAIKYVEEFVKDSDVKSFIKDYLLQSAVIRQFEIIGEAANNISKETGNKFPEVAWGEIKGFRNLLIHEYFR